MTADTTAQLATPVPARMGLGAILAHEMDESVANFEPRHLRFLPEKMKLGVPFALAVLGSAVFVINVQNYAQTAPAKYVESCASEQIAGVNAQAMAAITQGKDASFVITRRSVDGCATRKAHGFERTASISALIGFLIAAKSASDLGFYSLGKNLRKRRLRKELSPQ